MTPTLVALIVLAVLLLLVVISIGYTIVIYNGLVALKNNVDKTWSNIDVLLKQRFDELPKLVKVCEGYMQHERETLEAVIKARNFSQGARGDAEQRQAQDMISGALKSLFAVVERYPELKADQGFRQLQARVTELENQIADRRELFNESVNILNTRIEQFPDVIIARMFNFTRRTLWEIEPAHRQDVEIRFGRG